MDQKFICKQKNILRSNGY
ncbi:hypothetical protein CAEBREN_02379 [Caenorhabditis brenneri]|uniref:Uncharacterized protein n=1 Tax=Caenorhabditis brenneri TaxID=135651 RepID=G0MTI2_CAEBE|nr:hypothetical protein CAEBREN_02379 [Caenorhabditis brenneri]